MMLFNEFLNALKILRSIDKHELIAAGVSNMADDREWVAFREKPHDWLLRAAPAESEKVWRLMLMRAA